MLSQTKETRVFKADLRPLHFLNWTMKPSLLPRKMGLMLKRFPTKAAELLIRPVLDKYFKSPTVKTPFIFAG